MPTWIEDLLRNLFFGIDNVVYYFVSVLYELLMYLANVNVFGTNDDVIGEFLRRIYALLGIFMLFKVSFSVLQYIIDPNSFSDNSKGMGKLVRNVIVTLVLLALTPALFSLAFDIQERILNTNVISKLILGDSTGDNVTSDEEDSVNNINAILANDMRFLVFGSFFTVNTDLIPECEDGPVLGTKAMAASTATNSEGKTCLQQITDLLGDQTSVDVHNFFRINNTDERTFESFGSLTALSQDNQHYFNYQFLISTIAGIFIVIMLLSYCIDVAVRIIKLFFLEIIAPIPIVSFVDPKQGKDGMLYKWAMECGKTYASLFIRLAIIFLSFYLIDLVASMNLVTPDNYYNNSAPEGGMAVLVTVMIIFGILIFANQAPKLIESIFGIKFTGELSVNPLKRLKDAPFAGGATAAALGLGAGAWAGARAGSDAGATGKGALFGAITGVRQGLNMKDKIGPGSFGKVRKGVYKDMTGNDLATFNPMQRVMSAGSKKHIDEVGKPLKNARQKLNNLHTQLSAGRHRTAESSEFLIKNGFDLSKLSDTKTTYQPKLEKAKAELMKARSSKAEASQMAKIDQALQNKNLDQDTRNAYEAQKKQLETQLSQYEDVAKAQNDVKEYQQVIDNIEVYQTDTALRQEISRIEGDIKKLSNEKSQRENFYNIDTSPTEDVQKLIKKYGNDDNK